MTRPAKSRTLLIPLALVLALVGCGQGPQDSASELMAVSNCGQEVAVPKAPENVMVVGGEAGTIVSAAGGGGSVGTFMPMINEPLGDTKETFTRATITEVQTVVDISKEAVIEAAPDVVVTVGFDGFSPEDLQAEGIATLVISGYCGGFGAGESTVEHPMEEMFDDVMMLGAVFATEDVAQTAVSDMRERVEAVQAKAQRFDGSRTAAAVFAVDGQTPLGAYGARSMIAEQLRYLEFANSYAATPERYFEPNQETLIEQAPTVIVALYEDADTTEQDAIAAVADRPTLSEVPAVVNDAIIPMNFFYAGHGTLAVDGLEKLSEVILD